MDLEAIDRLGLTLYRDPEAHVPMCDALEDLGLRWSDWLERGSLERLAEYMCGLHAGIEDRTWAASVGAFVGALQRVEVSQYIALCAAFRVPAVQVEVGAEDISRVDDLEIGFVSITRWHPPSVELAKATLTLFLALGVKRAMLEDRVMLFMVRQHTPQATSYRLRIGTGDWTERQL